MSNTHYDFSFYRDYRKGTSTICPDCGHGLSMKVEAHAHATGGDASAPMGNVIEILWCQNCGRRPDI